MGKANEFHKKQIARLQKKIEDLKEINYSLERENLSLKKERDTEQKFVQDLILKHKKAIEEAKNSKAKYDDLISETLKQKKQFSDKITILLRRLKKQK